MFKLDLEKAENQRSNRQHPWIIEKAREFQKNMCFTIYSKKSLTVWITTNWKILKEMGIPDHLTCLLRSLYAGQEATVRTGHGTMDWFKIGKGVRQGCILSPCLFNLYAECSVSQCCPTLCNPMDCSPPGSSVHGILQARILKWVAISFSRASSRSRDRTLISCIGRWILYL